MERIRFLSDAINNEPHGENFWQNKVSYPQFISQLFANLLMVESYFKALKLIRNFNIDELSDKFKDEILISKNWHTETPNYLNILKANLSEINS